MIGALIAKGWKVCGRETTAGATKAWLKPKKYSKTSLKLAKEYLDEIMDRTSPITWRSSYAMVEIQYYPDEPVHLYLEFYRNGAFGFLCRQGFDC